MTQQYIERYWRDAMPEDTTKPQWMVARFKHYPDGFPGNWEIAIDLLGGFSRDKSGAIVGWFDSSGNRFNNAQVYDAPDPGEGWRLVDVDSETPQHGDEFFAQSSKVWCFCNDVTRMTGFSKGLIIRRRITPAVTYVPFMWEDRDQLRGRWITWKHENGLMIESQIDHIIKHRDGGVWFKSHDAKWLLENATFLDTGKPAGKEVTQ